MKKFQEMAIDNCEQLRRVPKLRLQTTFGKKLGEGLWSLCRGIDERPLVTGWKKVLLTRLIEMFLIAKYFTADSTRKSIGAEVNWGVRFQEDSQVIRFLSEIVDEVVSRMKAAGYFGLRVTVKAKKAKPGVTPMKHGGHGPCFNFSKFVFLYDVLLDMNLPFFFLGAFFCLNLPNMPLQSSPLPRIFTSSFQSPLLS